MNLLSLKELEETIVDNYREISESLLHVDLDYDLEHIAIIASYYNGLLSMLKRKMTAAQKQLELFESSRTVEVSHDTSGGKKPTVAMIAAIVKSDPRWLELNEDLQNKETIYSLVKSLCSGLSIKKDMLVQLSANKRAETNLYN